MSGMALAMQYHRMMPIKVPGALREMTSDEAPQDGRRDPGKPERLPKRLYLVRSRRIPAHHFITDSAPA
jgi:hypothetical protein